VNALLSLSRFIDALNENTGRLVFWLVLGSCLVSAFNALSRYGLGVSSNAWLELQWYMFALIFLLGAGYTLKHNGHVRIDILYGRFSPRTQAWIDLLGALIFLLPVSFVILWLSWPMFLESFRIDETSPDAGGLLRWPIKLAIPLGFALLSLQGISESIKRIAFLAGKTELGEEHAEEHV
jgi:TRAP-type mannitol/chloroaromatic compound transport system permease small subunit